MIVEYYRMWDNHTWDTDFIHVPGNPPEEQLDEAIRTAAAKIAWQNDVPVIVGLYCAGAEEDYEEDANE